MLYAVWSGQLRTCDTAIFSHSPKKQKDQVRSCYQGGVWDNGAKANSFSSE